MLQLLRRASRHRQQRQQAIELYAVIVACMREPIYFTHGGVADTFTGRLRLLQLLIAMQIAVLPRRSHLARLLLQTMVNDLDNNYRELGIGDYRFARTMKKSIAILLGLIEKYCRLIRDDLVLINNGDATAVKVSDNSWLAVLQSSLLPEVVDSAAQRQQAQEDNSIVARKWLLQIRCWEKRLTELKQSQNQPVPQQLAAALRSDKPIWTKR